jgi:aminopeptidase N
MGSKAVKRIEDVRLLRAAQFPEDSGPLAHPVRPESYIEITNFYTATVYNKGAEVIRMMRTILGEEAFREGSDLYFARHDGEAVTCEDFVRAMEDASGVDLSQFRLWYSQAGTPQIKARLEHDEAAATATLHLSQIIPDTPGQSGKSPMVVPLITALIGADSGAPQGEEQLVLLEEPSASIRFEGVTEAAMLSINRDFSAPVLIDVQRRAGELERLAEVDPNPFARYEALQELMLRALLAGARGEAINPAPVIAAMHGTIRSNALDPAFKGEALSLPTEGLIGDRMELVEPDAIHRSREALRQAVGSALTDDLARTQAMGAPGTDLSPDAKGIRRLKTVALALLSAGDSARGAALAKSQFDAADNMTDRQGALMVLASLDGPEREAAFAKFYERYRDDSLVLDKWFALQAAAQRADTVDMVEMLAKHPAFSARNPNRWRALVSNFAANQWAFHHASGRGYGFVTDMILEVDRINPQVAARQVPSLGRWKRFEPRRAELMRGELERIVKTPGLSKDVFEQVSKSLA